ncbi:hypothetical protein J6590_080916 [Homalodisca vitripennis]|nr:hypothetical protein J6590_080916 [Homalodisca vitripennis]
MDGTLAQNEWGGVGLDAVRGHCLLVRPVHQLIEMSTVIRSRAGSRREGDQCWSIDDSVRTSTREAVVLPLIL